MTQGLLLLFEDEHASSFEPLALLRSVARLRLGAWTHAERWERLAPARELALVCREALADVERETGTWREVTGGGATSAPRASNGSDGTPDTLFVAARLGRPDASASARILGLATNHALLANGRLIAARASGRRAAGLRDALAERAGVAPIRFDVDPEGDGTDETRSLESSGFSVSDLALSPPRTLAELLADAADALASDFEFYSSAMGAPDVAAFPGVHFLRPDRIRLGEDVRLDPGVVLDARDGPILLGPGACVSANSVLAGPVAIGPRCLVKPGAKILHGTCVGPVCKIGGEIEGSILQGFSNKQHDGFLGHSILGEWVNLGAATDTSDLKNNYGEVRLVVAGRERSTGTRHIGSFFGDHTKTGIHTMLNTGTVVGAFSNLFGASFPPKEVPSFAWGGDGVWHEHRLEKALEVARIVTGRRELSLSRATEALAARVFEATAGRRAAWLSQSSPRRC